MKNYKSLFIWNGTRISFWLMITLFVLSALIENELGILGYLWMVSIFPTFTFSIIHLFKYKEKALAITSLSISGLFVIIFLLGIFGV